MSLQCPRCFSVLISQKRSALKVGASISAISGMTRGINLALCSGRTGSSIGSLAGPFGAATGAVAGVVLGGLVGGVKGCLLGAQLGDQLDRQVLLNNECQECGYRFNTRSTSA